MPTTRKRVHFEDLGQDMLWLDVEKDGDSWIVVDSNLQGWFWRGCRLRGIRRNAKPIIRWRDRKYADNAADQLRYRVTRITAAPAKQSRAA